MGDDVNARSCFNCRFLIRTTESWEMPHIYWYECNARPANGMLKQFPFKSTRCKYWERSQSPKCGVGPLFT